VSTETGQLQKNLNMVSDSALSRTNRRMTSSKYDCQPLVGGRRLQRVTNQRTTRRSGEL
jgi:hypothetical protein